ncbi:solute carrier family 22 member 18 isoform X1 [Ornithorhynchus anatinus]|uniref:solute carrier family 22 member 18 isoform X1 n=1 Tax=Ornithorhynchus anatinus TaxID=9258 RepID=UPI0010A8E6C8|nr:solute carrier family 22 member 18 isoform X1 [Ornithorhynchus anatinus]
MAGLSRWSVIRVTYLLTVIQMTCLFMQFSVLLYVANELGLDSVGFGLLQTTFGLLQLLGSPVFGRFPDGHHRPDQPSRASGCSGEAGPGPGRGPYPGPLARGAREHEIWDLLSHLRRPRGQHPRRRHQRQLHPRQHQDGRPGPVHPGGRGRRGRVQPEGDVAPAHSTQSPARFHHQSAIRFPRRYLPDHVVRHLGERVRAGGPADRLPHVLLWRFPDGHPGPGHWPTDQSLLGERVAAAQRPGARRGGPGHGPDDHHCPLLPPRASSTVWASLPQHPDGQHPDQGRVAHGHRGHARTLRLRPAPDEDGGPHIGRLPLPDFRGLVSGLPAVRRQPGPDPLPPGRLRPPWSREAAVTSDRDGNRRDQRERIPCRGGGGSRGRGCPLNKLALSTPCCLGVGAKGQPDHPPACRPTVTSARPPLGC